MSDGPTYGMAEGGLSPLYLEGWRKGYAAGIAAEHARLAYLSLIHI